MEIEIDTAGKSIKADMDPAQAETLRRLSANAEKSHDQPGDPSMLCGEVPLSADDRALLAVIDERDSIQDAFDELAAALNVETEYSNIRSVRDVTDECLDEIHALSGPKKQPASTDSKSGIPWMSYQSLYFNACMFLALAAYQWFGIGAAEFVIGISLLAAAVSAFLQKVFTI